ncbi:MAG: 3-phosphoserine/phosphohydroxythreonine transaminase [Flavobacteriales bacterium]|nr:3-phosphoserine/phosphohydroxythreonine transaminase [Flavobacteriales bacterium]MCX7649024.1 3-phosphoserine/phosphohydroxythreonine transaminase [Flavobacteriales bacterium]MDW8431091.1 3-phosphoserine/phosphohydroxythreonine transaminase [Flavobacteriales bacterium]
MSSHKKIHNFSAGPAILPPEVLEQAAESIREFDGMGLSLLEISHRSKNFERVMDEARQLVAELTGLGNEYDYLFLQGGASLQFYQVPLNLLRAGGKAGYVLTGEWALRAYKEAGLVGETQVVASSEDAHFSYIPKHFEVPKDLDYLHITSNNTIFGTQYHSYPDVHVPLVCDMSSDIFSRPVDFSKFTLIYAGAQKNIGPAGVTLVIVRRDAVGKSGRKLPTLLDYQTHIQHGSMYNTPPVFAVYVTLLTLRWIKTHGGLAGMEQRNRAKQDLFYTALDACPIFEGTARREDRSWMNATFRLCRPELQEAFEQLQKEAGISQLKGHRSVGGYRASMYNALPLESVKALTDIMYHLNQSYA